MKLNSRELVRVLLNEPTGTMMIFKDGAVYRKNEEGHWSIARASYENLDYNSVDMALRFSSGSGKVWALS